MLYMTRQSAECMRKGGTDAAHETILLNCQSIYTCPSSDNIEKDSYVDTKAQGAVEPHNYHWGTKIWYQPQGKEIDKGIVYRRKHSLNSSDSKCRKQKIYEQSGKIEPLGTRGREGDTNNSHELSADTVP